MFKMFFEFLTEPLGLPIEWYWEYLILAVIGFVAYAFAYQAVGDMYDSGTISGRGLGAFFHWLIRLVIFAIIWAVTYSVIAAVKWLCANWVLVLCILGGVLLLAGIVGIILVVRRKERNKKVMNDA